MDRLEYWFDKNKDWNKYQSGQSLTETDLKKRFQTLFQNTNNSQGRNLQNEIFDVIWANVNLRGSLFPTKSRDEDRADALVNFQTMINTLDNKLFGFIKVK